MLEREVHPDCMPGMDQGTARAAVNWLPCGVKLVRAPGAWERCAAAMACRWKFRVDRCRVGERGSTCEMSYK
jgi:hypothetical protein